MKRVLMATVLCAALLAFTATPTVAGGVHLSSVERQILELINEQRADHDLAPLRAQTNLERCARAHSSDMARVPYFSHISPDGRTPFQRMTAAGYTTRGFRSWAIGEALAFGSAGCASPEQIVSDWMGSPPHRAILLGRFSDAGIGVAVGSYDDAGVRLDGVTYFTLDVGQRTR